MNPRTALLLLLTGVLLLAMNVPVDAQTASGIRGIVLDKDGAPLPGATITVTNSDLGISVGAVSNEKGEFRVAPLPPGRGYSVQVKFPTMSTITLSDIDVGTGRLTAVPVTLRPSSELKETVKVIGATETVNTENTTTETKFSKEFIDSLPIIGRNYQDVLKLAPGVADVDGDGNPNIHGARDTDVITLVDGVSTTDPLTGQQGQQLNIDSIQEIEVKTSGASAEFGRGQGGFVNILTKSGGNDFQGSFSFFYRSNVFDGDGAGIDNPRLHGGTGEAGLRNLSFADYEPFLSLGGPIKKDKAWYFLTAEYIQLQTPVNALTQAFVRGTKEKRVFGKLSWDVSTNQKLVFTVTVDPQEYTNLGLDSLTAIESGYTDKLGGTNLVLKGTSIFNPNVFLETTLQHFNSKPQQIPTLNADTNGNGVLFIDRNNNGFIDATERDPGEDYDRDHRWDVFEDTLIKNGALDLGEDKDLDGRLTANKGCEGVNREDIDCDGNLDTINEDDNGNGVLDPGEDRDGDNFLDTGNEDRNHNKLLDDRSFVQLDDIVPGVNGQNDALYPYERQFPIPRDLDYSTDQKTLRTSGPFLESWDGSRGRLTLRQDLTVFVPDWFGQHDMKFGGKIERENFNQTTALRPWLLPNAQPPTQQSFQPTIGAILPSVNSVYNEATSTTLGFYMNDVYKPLPNLTIQLGVRFDREATDSFGYTPFDPTAERQLFDRLWNLGGGERKSGPDDIIGNNDHINSQGYCSDPWFSTLPNGANPCDGNYHGAAFLDNYAELQRKAPSRLTQHHISTSLVANSLQSLFTDLHKNDYGEIDRNALRELGATVVEDRQPFRLTNNNLSPRLSISWDPWADSKTKLFANWSRFYDKLFLNSIIGEEGPDTISRYYGLDRDGVTEGGVPDNGIGNAISKAPPSATQIDRGLQTPFTDELTLGFERELAPELSLKITFIDRKFREQLQDIDINHTLRFDSSGNILDSQGKLVFPQGGGSPTRAADGRPDLYIENFFFNQIFRLGNFNRARYKGIEVELTKRLSRKWQMEGSYSYSRARGQAESFDSALGDDPATRPQEYGYLDFDQRHVVKLNMVTYLPKDWQVGATFSWGSGLPYSIISQFLALDNYDYAQYRQLFGTTIRNPDQADVDAHPDRAYIFQPIERNSLRNHPIYNIDLLARKAFVLGRFNSKLFITVENLLNTDDLTITQYEPQVDDRAGAFELTSERRFGRRFEVGFQFEF
jgi:Carboxypeptidase regulatory-like domain/TonB-dependent Receptor Plug Domain/TonB dependent receptor-like, beta-barrel